jgi:hypothetical protein
MLSTGRWKSHSIYAVVQITIFTAQYMLEIESQRLVRFDRMVVLDLLVVLDRRASRSNSNGIMTQEIGTPPQKPSPATPPLGAGQKS